MCIFQHAAVSFLNVDSRVPKHLQDGCKQVTDCSQSRFRLRPLASGNIIQGLREENTKVGIEPTSHPTLITCLGQNQRVQTGAMEDTVGIAPTYTRFAGVGISISAMYP